jgi:hypothetical protein
MLAQRSKKVLEQLGEDHHVLIPSRSLHLDVCIYGERFAENQQCNQREGYPHSEPAETLASPANLSQTINIHEVSSLPAVDWREWDAPVGRSLSFVS